MVRTPKKKGRRGTHSERRPGGTTEGKVRGTKEQ